MMLTMLVVLMIIMIMMMTTMNYWVLLFQLWNQETSIETTYEDQLSNILEVCRRM
jgi:hypothetical protein